MESKSKSKSNSESEIGSTPSSNAASDWLLQHGALVLRCDMCRDPESQWSGAGAWRPGLRVTAGEYTPIRVPGDRLQPDRLQPQGIEAWLQWGCVGACGPWGGIAPGHESYNSSEIDARLTLSSTPPSEVPDLPNSGAGAGAGAVRGIYDMPVAAHVPATSAVDGAAVLVWSVIACVRHIWLGFVDSIGAAPGASQWRLEGGREGAWGGWSGLGTRRAGSQDGRTDAWGSRRQRVHPWMPDMAPRKGSAPGWRDRVRLQHDDPVRQWIRDGVHLHRQSTRGLGLPQGTPVLLPSAVPGGHALHGGASWAPADVVAAAAAPFLSLGVDILGLAADGGASHGSAWTGTDLAMVPVELRCMRGDNDTIQSDTIVGADS